MENINSYYKICGVKSPDDQINPIFNQLEKDIVASLLGSNSNIYLTTKDDIKTFNETIIGGKREKKENKKKKERKINNNHINNREPKEQQTEHTDQTESKNTIDSADTADEPIAYPTSIVLSRPLKFKMVKLLFLIPKNN